MKKIIPSVQLVFTFILLSLISGQSFSQVSVVSNNGYAVNISVTPVAIVPTSASCTWGYNYNVKLKYSITFSGNNVPASMYTLQGTLGCGSASHFFDLPNNGGSGVVTSGSNQWSSVSDCNTATVITKNCNTINIAISGPGISYRTISMAAAPSVLGIKLMSFDAELLNSKVKLGWATASETDNDYFSIERSADGTQWEEIRKVKGSGNSNSIVSYEAYDDSPLTGTSHYRLKQTDFDGQTSFSDIKTVKYVRTGKGITVYPVPNTGNTVNFSGITDFKNQELSIVNAAGSIVYTASLNKASVELPGLDRGMYVLRVKNRLSGETESLRYVKM